MKHPTSSPKRIAASSGTALPVLLFLHLCCATIVSGQVILDRLLPVSGSTGTTAALLGAGFQGSPQVQINGLNASVTSSSATQVNFTIPANAVSGPVAVRINNIWYTNPVPFTITRSIQGTFNP